MSDTDGGPAFPLTKPNPYGSVPSGMSLRDYFAGQALAGFMSNPAHNLRFEAVEDANFAYAIADAMLKERLK